MIERGDEAGRVTRRDSRKPRHVGLEAGLERTGIHHIASQIIGVVTLHAADPDASTSPGCPESLGTRDLLDAN